MLTSHKMNRLVECIVLLLQTVHYCTIKSTQFTNIFEKLPWLYFYAFEFVKKTTSNLFFNIAVI